MSVECTRYIHIHILISSIDLQRFHKGYDKCDTFSQWSYPSPKELEFVKFQSTAHKLESYRVSYFLLVKFCQDNIKILEDKNILYN